ncbi:DNA-binding anti-repressor SinI [bacterium LRH843]|nr:DNA-binding anti-repressor SinI [bacterium LRH843]
MLLILKAKDMGMDKEEVRDFLRHKGVKQLITENG